MNNRQQPQIDFTKLDLNINNYTVKDLYALFQLNPSESLNETMLKNVRNTVLSFHPDKVQQNRSSVSPQIYEFFTKSYDKLKDLYDYQNLTERDLSNANLTYNSSSFVDVSKTDFVTKRNLQYNPNIVSIPTKKNAAKHNEWFNEMYNECTADITKDSNSAGYDSWLKSNEGIVELPPDQKFVTGDMPIFQSTELMQYKGDVMGYNEPNGSCNILNDIYMGSTQNASVCGAYTDIKQAYTTFIVQPMDDPRQKTHTSLKEYSQYRDNLDYTPLDKHTAERMVAEKHMNEQHSLMDTMLRYDNHMKSVQEKIGKYNKHITY